MKKLEEINLDELIIEAFTTAKNNGWHEKKHSDEHCMMLVITEISEAVQAHRKGLRANMDGFRFWMDKPDFGQRFKQIYESCISGTVEDELSDVVIRCLDYCGLRGVEGVGLYEVSDVKPERTFTEHMFHVCQQFTSHYLVSLMPRFVCSYSLSYIFTLCRNMGIDLPFFIRQKMEYNKLRGYHHGSKKY